MTTIVLAGVRVFFDENGDPSSLSSASAEIVLPPNTSGTFSYTITGYDEGVPLIELDEDALEIRLDGQTLSALEGSYDVQPLIARVQWSGGTTTILGVNIAPQNGGNDSEMYFVLDGPAPVVHMCGSGVTACLNLLAMEEAGFNDNRLYVGSWSEWIRDPDRPVATSHR